MHRFKRHVFLATALVAALSIGSAAFAQPGSGDRRGKRGDRAAKMERVKELRGKLLRDKVGLNEARAQKVEAILEAQRDQQKALRESVRTNMRALRTLIESDSNDQPAYQAAIDGLRAARAQMQALRDAQFTELSKVLSSREQATLMLAMKRVKGHMGRHGRRGGGDGHHRGRHKRGERGAGPGADLAPDDVDGPESDEF